MFLFDSKTFDEILFPKDSVWINDHICFINTTYISEFHFEKAENNGANIFEIVVFDGFQGKDLRTEISNDGLRPR